MREIRKIIGVILLVFIISIGFVKPVQEYVSIPKELVLMEGQQQPLQKALPVFKMSSNKDYVSVNEEQFAVLAKRQGDANVTVTVGGAPVKNVDVRVLKDIKVVPGGQSIGVKLNTLGVLVVGHHLVDSDDGEKSPGELAEIEVGDIITKINGKKIENMSQVTPLVQEAGENETSLKLEVIRENEVLQKKLTPLKAKGESSYRLGLYIRDSAAGVGTLTFYEPKSKSYGALGHVISDMDTQKPIVVNDGQIVSSLVTSIEKGSNGDPGEKLARFTNDRKILGTITKNSPFGIFGKLHEQMKNNVLDKAMPITLAHQVKEGPAKILTVVDGEEVKEYDIEIVSSVPQKFPATKGMVIKVTDPVLLEATGGIIQGMSGSPIIQDGKVIGAVTHVFVNDPTSGYACHIEWMLQEAGVDIYNKEKAKAS
ncbi:SpoIVB peptidase [Anaerobacillus isosaccharinicus]|uniref:SpoIVB peptidase n=1 Tax=Anaerobacillus isosaccharinicus TaxID=1532552 RepID=A0A1S2MH88_9BACI|nr:SpoIVB peptidase [Anaerobacillus isosaccharinicus]MBA5585632.1 SpoIVB peptidase [Anaerobacillus isosaccharinicus]QOY36059.1 SpoIVB peptidase [Anaerobacillus isosaccharinicus]